MGFSFVITLPEQTKRNLRALDDLGKRWMPVLLKAQNLATAIVTGDIVKHRFRVRGRNSLGVRSGRLWRSVAAWPKEHLGKIDGVKVITSIGSNVKYLGPHEYGFDGNVDVPSHSRRVKGARAVATVKAHKRHMRLPARRMIRGGLSERRGMFNEALSKSVIQQAKVILRR